MYNAFTFEEFQNIKICHNDFVKKDYNKSYKFQLNFAFDFLKKIKRRKIYAI